MQTYNVRRTWQELRQDHVEVNADSADHALQLACDFDANPITNNAEFLEISEVDLTVDADGNQYTKSV